MLLDRIEKLLKARRMPPTRFGREAVRDPKFVFDLREGREPRSATVKRVTAYLERQERELER
jgi:2,4-dienoyl-CoA reductase-like NADH-dependent reductase (Old Yellow Enzyme family)